MTHAEREVIESAAPFPAALSFVPHADSRFVRLLAAPCPLLDGDRCSVHAVRPYNCRRWGCFEQDVSQPLTDLAPVPAHVLASRELRRQYAAMQRHGQRWARSHGWEVV